MTFQFLDRVADVVGPSEALLASAREHVFRKPLRHEGLCRQSREAVRDHVAGVMVRVANERLREPLKAAISAHAQEAGDLHEMSTGDAPGSEDYQRAVVAAFAGNDVGIDLSVFAVGEATPDAAADQVLKDVKPNVALSLARRFVSDADLDAVVDEILAPQESAAWSLARMAEEMRDLAGLADGQRDEEGLRYLLCESDGALRETGITLLGMASTPELHAWLDERAMFSSPESDEADVAEILRLVNEEGGGLHSSAERLVHESADDKTTAGAESEAPALAADTECTCPGKGEGVGAHLLTCPMSPKYNNRSIPVAAEPSDVTRAVAGALKALFELTKESDTNVAKVLGVDKAVVAQSRKGTTPWSPAPKQLGALSALVGRYNDGLAAAAGALGALPVVCYEEQDS